MDQNLTLLRLASSLAAHATARQGLIGENVAQADTPGYRARDLPEFAATLEEGPGFAGRATRAGHLVLEEGGAGFEPVETTAFGAETPNGNTVSLEDQMMRAAETRQSHELALGVYRKTMDILRAGLGRAR
jgi:flagellar basal-body rod protein FlgB